MFRIVCNTFRVIEAARVLHRNSSTRSESGGIQVIRCAKSRARAPCDDLNFDDHLLFLSHVNRNTRVCVCVSSSCKKYVERCFLIAQAMKHPRVLDFSSLFCVCRYTLWMCGGGDGRTTRTSSYAMANFHCANTLCARPNHSPPPPPQKKHF